MRLRPIGEIQRPLVVTPDAVRVSALRYLSKGDFDDVVGGVGGDDYLHSKVAVTELIVKWGLSGK